MKKNLLNLLNLYLFIYLNFKNNILALFESRIKHFVNH